MEVPNETRICGTRGGLKFGFCSWDEPRIIRYGLDKNGRAYTEEIPVAMEGHDDGYALAEHVTAVLDGKEEPVISLDLARKHMDIIQDCDRVARN